jgi:membrane-associated protease RseP (regulator of RpoE activity)
MGYYLVHSQNVKKDKEIVIIKKTIDKDGNEVIEKIVKSGNEAEDFDLDDLDLDLEEMMEDGNIKIDVRIEDSDGSSGERKIIINGKEFNYDTDFNWNGKIDMESLMERFEDSEFEFEFNGDHNYFFHQDDVKRKAFLGIRMTDEEIGEENGKIVITDVYEGSAAEEAGLQSGDVLISIDAEAINSLESVVDAVNKKSPGEVIDIAYLRAGVRSRTKATLKGPDHDILQEFDFPKDHHQFKFDNFKRNTFEFPKAYIGIEIEEMEDGSGILITKVVDGSPAQKAGLRNGDIVQKIDGQKIQETNELIDNIGSREIGSEVELEYRREGKVNQQKVALEQRKSSVFGKCYGPNMAGKDIDIKITNLFEDEEKNEFLGEGFSDNQNNLEMEEINVYPNPTDRLVNIGFTTVVKGGPIEIKITDIAGREVYSDKIGDFQGSYRNTINMEKNPNGIYVVSIIQNGKVWTERIALNRN